MNKRFLSVLALSVAALLAGCGGGSNRATISLSWAVTVNGLPVSCAQVGATQIIVTATRGGVSSDIPFDCARGVGEFHLRAGIYTFDIRMVDSAGTILGSVSVAQDVFAGTLVVLGPFDFRISGGTVRLSWSLNVNGAPGTCAQVGASEIVVIAMRGGTRTDVFFDCTPSGAGEFPTLAGLYSFEIQLIDVAGNRLNSVPVIITRDVFAGDIVNLGNFEFDFNLSYSATFTVQMGDNTVTGNCTASNPGGGAGVAVEEIRVSTGGACIPMTLSGILSETNQPTTGQTCSLIVCQPETVVHVLEGLTPGNYQIQVFGYKGAIGPTPVGPCYLSTIRSFTITSGNVNLGTIVAPYDLAAPSECDATKPQGA
jgi:hypothetical protein